MDSFLRVLTSVRGFSAAVVAQIIQQNDFKIVQHVLSNSLVNPSTAFDAVVFFNDVVLRVRK